MSILKVDLKMIESNTGSIVNPIENATHLINLSIMVHSNTTNN